MLLSYDRTGGAHDRGVHAPYPPPVEATGKTRSLSYLRCAGIHPLPSNTSVPLPPRNQRRLHPSAITPAAQPSTHPPPSKRTTTITWPAPRLQLVPIAPAALPPGSGPRQMPYGMFPALHALPPPRLAGQRARARDVPHGDPPRRRAGPHHPVPGHQRLHAGGAGDGGQGAGAGVPAGRAQAAAGVLPVRLQRAKWVSREGAEAVKGVWVGRRRVWEGWEVRETGVVCCWVGGLDGGSGVQAAKLFAPLLVSQRRACPNRRQVSLERQPSLPRTRDLTPPSLHSLPLLPSPLAQTRFRSWSSRLTSRAWTRCWSSCPAPSWAARTWTRR